jgi:threonine dehydrogenase-like Zn-dependent dehydrogenase
MQAVWLTNQKLSLVEAPVPVPAENEALIRVRLAGICNTDIELLRGYYPYHGIPGHEFVGTVEQGPPEWLERRVCGEINAACGGCKACLNQRRNHCDHRTVLGIVGRNGVFAEYLTLPAENLIAVPETVSDEEAVFTEPLAAALEIQQQIRIRPTDRVVVVGDGKLGLLIAQVLSLSGCAVAALGRHAKKLEILSCRGIETHVVKDTASLPEISADVAVEATGSPQGFDIARRLVRPRGILVLKSTYHGDMRLNMSRIVVDEITLVGSRCGPFAPALDLLRRKMVDVLPMIHARYDLREAPAAFEQAQRPGVLKVLLEPRTA